MISVIVCSKYAQPREDWHQQLAGGIGLPFELIWIHNGEGKSLGAQWNAGAEKAIHPLLCFMHDDATVLTLHWGVKAVAHIEAGAAVLAIAGSRYRSAKPSGWMSGLPGCDYYHVYHLQDGKRVLWSNRSQTTVSTPVLVADGVWLCCPRAHWQTTRFAENLPAPFHHYDLDFTVRSSQTHRVAVVHDIDLVHQSGGRFDTAWVEATLCYTRRQALAAKLPHCLGDMPGTARNCEAQVRRFWKQRLRNEPVSRCARLKWDITSL